MSDGSGITDAEKIPDLKLEAILDGENDRGIPTVKFLDDIDAFSKTFDPPASAELLIGAYSDIFAKFKSYEASLAQKSEFQSLQTRYLRACLSHMELIAGYQLKKLTRQCHYPGTHLQSKIPELEKSLSLVQYLQSYDHSEPLIARYSLADAVFGKAALDTTSPKVNLWLGANVMLEYSFDEAIELLDSKLGLARKELEEVTSDLGFTRNQIITAEVCISRIYNWDVRRKRSLQASQS